MARIFKWYGYTGSASMYMPVDAAIRYDYWLILIFSQGSIFCSKLQLPQATYDIYSRDI